MNREKRRRLSRGHAARGKARAALDATPSTVAPGGVPGWIHEGLRSVETKTAPGSMPVFVMLDHGAPRSEALAVVKLSELARFFDVSSSSGAGEG